MCKDQEQGTTTAESFREGQKEWQKGMKQGLYKEQWGRLGLFSLAREMTEGKGNRALGEKKQQNQTNKQQPEGNYSLYPAVEELGASSKTITRFKTKPGGLDTTCNWAWELFTLGYLWTLVVCLSSKRTWARSWQHSPPWILVLALAALGAESATQMPEHSGW